MAANGAQPTIAHLLQLVSTPQGPAQVAAALESHPALAQAIDQNGYSLLHAAVSYDALDLARALVTKYDVDPNRADSDGDTPLFYAETVRAAKCLVEELGADVGVRNEEGEDPLSSAKTNAEDMEGEWEAVFAYLDGKQNNASEAAQVHAPPPLPPNVRINMGTMREDEAGDPADADPEFRKRIEDLASREDFQDEEGQKELRKIVEDAMGGVASESAGESARRRMG